MPETNCIECEAVVPFADDVITGEIAQCPDCGIELEVLDVDPVLLGVAPEVEEDWGE